MTRFGLGIIQPRTPLRCVYRQVQGFNGALTTFTSNGASLGAAAPDRFVVVGVTGRGNSRIISSVTLDGVAMTLLTKNLANNIPTSGLFIRQVPTGSTATIAATFNGGQSNASIAVWTVYGPVDLASFSAQTILAEDPIWRTLTSRKGGVVIGISANTGTGAVHSWTNMTERFDQQVASGSTASGADAIAGGNTFDMSLDGWAALNAVSLASLWAGP